MGVLPANQEDFPVIDFSDFEQNPTEVSNELFEAACRWGFLILKGHGIPQTDVDKMFSLSKSFFEQPKEIKAEKWMNTDQVGYDYKESLIGIQEGFCFGSTANSNLTSTNLSSWWTMPRRASAEAFRQKCNKLSESLMKAFAMSMDLDPDFFSTAHSPDLAPGNVLRLIKYPALSSPPDRRFPRLGEHTDWGTLTLLFAKTAGLEVKSPVNGWVPAPIVEGAVIVNIADGLSLWSDKVLKSTMHRLSWDSLPYDLDRFSMAYFVNANAVAPLKFLTRKEGKYVEADMPFDATFGDYQAVRMRIIHEKFDSDEKGEGPTLDPKFVDIVRNLGVAHGKGLTFEGAEMDGATQIRVN